MTVLRRRSLFLSPGRWLLSLPFGLALGVSVYNFGLVQLFPPTSRRALLLTAVVCLLGALSYLGFLVSPTASVWKSLKHRQHVGIVAASVFSAIYLLSIINPVISAPETVTFLIPDQTVEIRVPASQINQEPAIVIRYFSTSLGDPPLYTAVYHGWERTDLGLQLIDAQNNSLRWTGKFGMTASVVFARSPDAGQVEISWDGGSELINLSKGNADRYIYNMSFPLPLYASNVSVLVLLTTALSYVIAAIYLWAFGSREIKDVLAYLRLTFNGITSKRTVSPIFIKSSYLFSALILFLLIVGFILRILNLGREPFYHDELTQFQALLGLKNLGELVLYNPFTDTSMGAYPRAGLLTLISFISAQLFGWSESAIRLPVAIFGWLILPSIFLVTKQLAGRFAAFVALLLATFNPYLIYISRFFRNYSPLTLFYFLCFGTLLLWIRSEISEENNTLRRIRFLSLIFVFFVFTYHFGYIQSLTLLPIVFLAFLIIIGKGTTPFYSRVISSALLITLLALLLISRDSWLEYLGFLEIATNPLLYLAYLLSFNFKVLLFLIFASSFLVYVAKRAWVKALINGTVIYLYLAVAFIGSRYEDFRYIVFVIPLMAVALGVAIKWLYIGSQLFFRGPLVKTMASLGALTLIFTIPTYPFLLQETYDPGSYETVYPQFLWKGNEGAIFIHRRAVAPDYRSAFDYLNNHLGKGDVVLVFGNEYVYLRSTAQNVYLLSRDSNLVQPLSSQGDALSLKRLLSANECERIWVVGTYIHLLYFEASDLLLESPEFRNIGKEIGLPYFIYDEWYENKDFTWPTLLVKEPSC
jgi:hypothetical protein